MHRSSGRGRKRDGVENQPYAEEVDMEEDQSPQQAATVTG